MTAKEMYLRVTNDLQSIGAQRGRKYAPEQIELDLNTEIENFVNGLFIDNGKGFYSIDERYYSSVQPLLHSKWLPVFMDSGKNYFSNFSMNYAKILDVGVTLSKDCGPAVSRNTKATNLKYYTLSLVPTSGSTEFFKNVKLIVNGAEVYKRTNGSYTTGDLFHLVNELVENVEGMHWENSNSFFSPGNLVFLSEGISSTIVLHYDDIVLNFSLAKTETYLEVRRGADDSELVPVRRLSNQSLYNSKAAAYYRSSNLEMIGTLEAYRMNLDVPKNLIVSALRVSYIRRPRKISLSLNHNSDLDSQIHGLICDRTVQRIRERVGDPKYQTGNIQESKS